MRPSRSTLAVFLIVLGVYVATARGSAIGLDGDVMLEVAHSVVTHGDVDIPYELPGLDVVHTGADGRTYAQYAPLPSVAFLPAAALWVATGDHAVGVLVARLTSSIAGALLCALFFAMVRRRGASRTASILATLTLAFGTQVFVYSRDIFSEPLQALCLLVLLDAFWRWEEAPGVRRAVWLGCAAGLLFCAKNVYALSLVGIALVLFFGPRRERVSWRSLPFAVLAALPFLGLTLGYNQLRWGDPLVTGYGTTLAALDENPVFGLWGMLFSPGRGLFFFNPAMVLVPVAIVGFARARGRDTWALAALALPPLALYSFFLSWSGDWAWGPRYVTSALALALLPLAPFLDRAVLGPARPVAKTVVAGILALSICVQLLGVAFDPFTYVNLTVSAREQWLGHADRSGARSGETPGDRCGWCFEDMHAVQWLPPFQQVRGHFWLARHVPFEDPWEVARRDVPWRRYTDLDVDVRGEYENARVDWLPLHRDFFAWGWIPCGAGLLLLALGIVFWRRREQEGAELAPAEPASG